MIYSRILGKTKIRWERNKKEDGGQLSPTSGGLSRGDSEVSPGKLDLHIYLLIYCSTIHSCLFLFMFECFKLS